MSKGERTAGQAAYENYCQATNWKSLVSGAQLPAWTEVKPEIKEAWDQAAVGVTDFLIKQGWGPPA